MSDYDRKYIVASAHIQQKIVDLIRLTDDEEYCNIYQDINNNIINGIKQKNEINNLLKENKELTEKNKLNIHVFSQDNIQKQGQIDNLKKEFLDLNEAYDKLLLELSNTLQEKEDITKENQINKKELQRYKDRYGWLCGD